MAHHNSKIVPSGAAAGVPFELPLGGERRERPGGERRERPGGERRERLGGDSGGAAAAVSHMSDA